MFDVFPSGARKCLEEEIVEQATYSPLTETMGENVLQK